MKVIKPLPVTDTVLITSNVPEDDAATWLIGTTYAVDDDVMLDHRVYRSVIDSNTGNDPRTDDGTNWLDMGFNNRWRSFDTKIHQLTSQLDTITYELVFDKPVSGIALLNVGAAIVDVTITDSSANVIYTRTINRFTNSAIVDYWTFFTTDISLEDVGDTIFDDVLGYPGNTVTITLSAVNASSIVSIGQILLGPTYVLGETLTNTTIGIRDFSTKERDAFGNAIIVERAFADTTTFQFYLRTEDGRRVRNILSSLRAYPSLYFISADAVGYGAQTYGFFQDFDIPLSASGASFANLKVEGLA
jgi:hypothetical protein